MGEMIPGLIKIFSCNIMSVFSDSDRLPSVRLTIYVTSGHGRYFESGRPRKSVIFRIFSIFKVHEKSVNIFEKRIFGEKFN